MYVFLALYPVGKSSSSVHGLTFPLYLVFANCSHNQYDEGWDSSNLMNCTIYQTKTLSTDYFISCHFLYCQIINNNNNNNNNALYIYILPYSSVSTYVGLYGSGLFNFGSYVNLPTLFICLLGFNVPTSFLFILLFLYAEVLR